MNKTKGLGGGRYRKVTITLPEDLEAFIDDLRRTIREQQGYSLGRTEIIRAAISYLRTIKIDLREIHDEEELLARLKKAK